MRRLLLSVVLLGCSSSEPAPSPPPSSDASTDAQVDAAPADTAGDGSDAACTLVKPYSSKDADCNACATAQCCAEVNGCLGNPRCDDDYVNCILACALLPADAGDPEAEKQACVAQCNSAHPEGKAAYDAAIGCVDAKCAASCE